VKEWVGEMKEKKNLDYASFVDCDVPTDGKRVYGLEELPDVLQFLFSLGEKEFEEFCLEMKKDAKLLQRFDELTAQQFEMRWPEGELLLSKGEDEHLISYFSDIK